jgi:hypothetical protein
MIIKESEARSDIYIGSESHDHPPDLSPSSPLHYTKIKVFYSLKVKGIPFIILLNIFNIINFLEFIYIN